MNISLTRARLAAGLALAVAAIAGVGWAAIPSAGGTISACLNNKGALKVIDADAGQGCGAQTMLQWSALGAPVAAPTLAYARVLPAEAGNIPVRVDAARSSGMTAANVSHQAGSGTFCFGGLPFTPKSITATPGLSVGLDEPTTSVFVRADVTGVNTCPAGFKQGVVVVTSSALTPRSADLYVVFQA